MQNMFSLVTFQGFSRVCRPQLIAILCMCVCVCVQPCRGLVRNIFDNSQEDVVLPDTIKNY